MENMMETNEVSETKSRFKRVGFIGLSLICALMITGLLLGLASLRFVKPAQAKNNNAPEAIGLGIDKSHTGDFTIGEIGTFYINISNTGDTEITIPVYFSDTLSDDFTLDSFDVAVPGETGWEITIKDQLLLAEFTPAGSIGLNEELPVLAIAVTTTETTLNQIKNSAAVTTTDSTIPTTDEDTVNIIGADLEVTKSVLPETAQYGQLVTYVINVKNNGPNNTTGVVLTDTLSSSLSLEGTPSATRGSYAPSTGIWTVGDLNYGDSATLTIIARINLGNDGDTINNSTSGLKSDITDYKASNNVGTDSFVIASPDLQIFKTDNRTSVSPSDRFTYTIYITNVGSLAATGIVITDVLPSHLAYVTDTLGITKISLGSNTYRWDYPNTINAGSSINFKLGVQAAAALPVSSQTNSVSVSTSTPEGNKTNNSSTDTDAVSAVDLEVSKSVSPATPLEGELITYTIIVTNTGPITATNVKITDTIPSGITFSSYSVSSTPAGQSYSSSTGLWTIGTLAKGVSTTLKIIGRINLDTDGDTIVNTASGLTSDYVDNDSSDNSDSVSFKVKGAPDLQIRKTDYQTTLSPSDEFTYTVFITNAGSVDATGIVITDILPTYLSYVTDTLQTLGITYTLPLAKNYRWDYPYDIEAGDTLTFELGVEAASSMAGTTQVNNISVNTSTDEGNTSNNSASDTDTISYTPSVSFSKSASPTQQALNGYITFYIYVTNNSSVSISSVVVKDTFNTSYLDIASVSTTRGSASYNSSSNLATISIGTLSAGYSATITVSCKVVSASTSIAYLTNYAYLTYSYSGSSFSKTASVSYRISSSSTTLPTTGGIEAPLNTIQSSGMTAGTVMAIVCCVLLFGLGLGLLVFGKRLKIQQSEWAGWCLRVGSGMLVVAVGFAIVAWGLSSFSNRPVAQAPEPTSVVAMVKEQQITDLRPIDIPISEDELEFLPDYPAPTPSFVPTPQYTEQPVDDSSPVRLLIPDLAVDGVVKYVPHEDGTWLISGLKQEIAWLGETSWPGLGGNTGLAGHVTLNSGENGPFRFLDQLNVGSVITLFTEKNMYTYKVRESKIVSSAETSVLDPTTKPSLTLITCTNWDKTLGEYVNRYIVFADLDTTVPITNGVTGN